MKISRMHHNRKHHNWLIYDIGDEWLRKFTDNNKGSLYDLGCGEMPYKDWLLNYADKYIGVDWGSTLHELKADILADLNEALPIDAEVADTVISLSVMEHLREPQLFLNEANRILKPGGVMILQVPFMWRVHEAPYDYFRYTRYGLQYMFEKAGFNEIIVYSQTGFWVMWTLKFNYQTLKLMRGPWLIRKPIGIFMRVFWEVNQRIAPLLDKHWKSESETAGYIVTAIKKLN
jgi:SAM-dependent methyltransferase